MTFHVPHRKLKDCFIAVAALLPPDGPEFQSISPAQRAFHETIGEIFLDPFLTYNDKGAVEAVRGIVAAPSRKGAALEGHTGLRKLSLSMLMREKPARLYTPAEEKKLQDKFEDPEAFKTFFRSWYQANRQKARALTAD